MFNTVLNKYSVACLLRFILISYLVFHNYCSKGLSYLVFHDYCVALIVSQYENVNTLYLLQ